MSVIVHGPRGCGKTQNAAMLARYFRVSRIVDEWDGVSALPSGCLALTSLHSFAVPAGFKAWPYWEAMSLVLACEGHDREDVLLPFPPLTDADVSAGFRAVERGDLAEARRIIESKGLTWVDYVMSGIVSKVNQ